MANVHQPNPDEIAQLIENDELIRYVVEELNGRITAIRTPPIIETSYLERRKATPWQPISTLSPLPSHQR